MVAHYNLICISVSCTFLASLYYVGITMESRLDSTNVFKFLAQVFGELFTDLQYLCSTDGDFSSFKFEAFMFLATVKASLLFMIKQFKFSTNGQ